MYRFLLVATLAVVAGCGFQLQGALTTPAAMERTYIATGDRHSLFYWALRERLRAAGVTLAESAAEASATFSILYDDTDQRVLSVSARNVPTEYEVYYTIEYVIESGAKKLHENQTLTVTRDYTYDSTLVLGKAHEEELMRDAIVDDLVRIVMKQIATL